MKQTIKLIAFFVFGIATTAMAQNEKTEKTNPTQSTTSTTTSSDPEETKVPRKIEDAYDAFEAKEYFDAIERIKDATSKATRDQKKEMTFMLAVCYKNTQNYKNAANQFKRAYKLKYGNIAQYEYALMLKYQGLYEDAMEAFQEYKKLEPSDEKGEIGIMSCKLALEWMDAPTRFQVNNMGDLNSKQHDYGVNYSGKINSFDEIYFGSMREESTGKDSDGWTGHAFSDIYYSDAERKKKPKKGKNNNQEEPTDLKWSTPLPLDEVINTVDHEGSGTFDSRRKSYYFTRCQKVKGQKLGCGIMVTKKQGQSWATPEEIVISQDSSVSIGHPALSPDDEILYFVSDMEGSLGGTDIWMTTYNRRKKEWSAPKNLGPKINTPGNERFPFVHDDGSMYFSSDGLPGMGGMDVFHVEMDENGMPAGDPENMKYPINTHSDDFNLIFEDGSQDRGFMTSDRKDGKGGYDIYSVYLVPLKVTIEGVVSSTKNGKPVPMATVRLDGINGTSVFVNADENGYYKFEVNQVEVDNTYKLSFEKQKYLVGTADATTVGIDFSAFEYVSSENYYLHTLKLNKGIDPIEVPIVLPNVFFDRAKWDLRPESMVALDTVVQILNNNPNIVIALRSHTDFRSNDQYNIELSQKRADTCASYIRSKGIAADRVESEGLGEKEPYVIPENYKGFGKEFFPAGTVLSEPYIKRLKSNDAVEAAHQLNRRSDFKVLRDDYVPEGGGEEAKPEEKVLVGEFHTVEKRETWVTITKKYKISLVELRKLNGGLRGVRPFPGLILKVTPGADYSEFDNTHYQIQRGDTSWKMLAKKLDLDAKELEKLNPDVDEKRGLIPGLYIRTR